MENIKMKPARENWEDQKVHSINHALSVLNEAADGSAEQIRSMMRSDYENLRKIMSGLTPEVRSVINEIKSATSDSIHDVTQKTADLAGRTAKQIDTSAHKNPWIFMGGTALMSLLVGYFWARNNRK